MSILQSKFYNIFWQNKSCRNLFLLSKEELLETATLGTENNSLSYTSNRIIISNAQENDDESETIKFRNENSTIVIDKNLEERVDYFKPLIGEFLDNNFKKAFDKLSDDIEKKGWSLLIKIIRLLANEKNREKNIIKLLKGYGFIGSHLTSFKQIEKDLENKFLSKKGNSLVNEHNIKAFFEGIKFVKELYVNNSYKKLYNTNQVLVNTLNSEEDFNSRIKLFSLLYDNKIIKPSSDDAFIECSNCEPGTYRGVFQLRLKPKNLKELKCPVCKEELTYYVPYELVPEIFEIVKQKDGLLHNALLNKLDTYGFEYLANQIFLNDIEIDCIYEGILGDKTAIFIVETKMYKLNTEPKKLKSKLKRDYGKLINDCKRLTKLKEFNGKWIKPLLLVNITDKVLINSVSSELKHSNLEQINQETEIMNIDQLEFKHP